MMAASADRLYAHEQFTNFKWFGHIIVRTGSKSLNFIIKFCFCGENKYRNIVSIPAQSRKNFITVHFRKHEI